MPATQPVVQELISEYQWFLEQTSKSKDELRSSFANDSNRREKRTRARDFGDKLFQLLLVIAAERPEEKRNLIRHLVV